MKYMFLRYPGGKFKAVTFSYDDGSIHDVRLAETLNKYGLKCSFNYHNSVVNNPSPDKISIDEIESLLLGNGHEVAVHGRTHAALGVTPSFNAVREVVDGRLCLEKAFNRIIRGFVYPDTMKFIRGEKYESIKSYLKELSLVYARVANTDFHDYLKDSDAFCLPDDFFFWVPTAHHDNKKIFEYMDSFLALDETKIYRASRHPRLFYIWGHSSEFESKGHWGHLETICEKISGKEDTWYATNIEIYDYVKAYESLILSADCTKVYNPTLHKIWFTADNVLYSVDSGETVTIAD